MKILKTGVKGDKLKRMNEPSVKNYLTVPVDYRSMNKMTSQLKETYVVILPAKSFRFWKHAHEHFAHFLFLFHINYFFHINRVELWELLLESYLEIKRKNQTL
jgi:hypothetical protein